MVRCSILLQMLALLQMYHHINRCDSLMNQMWVGSGNLDVHIDVSQHMYHYILRSFLEP